MARFGGTRAYEHWGLMELAALNVGYDLGIITPEIFAMMVLMALVTTAM